MESLPLEVTVLHAAELAMREDIEMLGSQYVNRIRTEVTDGTRRMQITLRNTSNRRSQPVKCRITLTDSLIVLSENKMYDLVYKAVDLNNPAVFQVILTSMLNLFERGNPIEYFRATIDEKLLSSGLSTFCHEIVASDEPERTLVYRFRGWKRKVFDIQEIHVTFLKTYVLVVHHKFGRRERQSARGRVDQSINEVWNWITETVHLHTGERSDALRSLSENRE